MFKNCRKHGFDSCPGKIPQAWEQLSWCIKTTEPPLQSPRAATADSVCCNCRSPCTVEPVLCNKRSHRNEKATHCKLESSPHSAHVTRESLLAAMKTQSSQKLIKKKKESLNTGPKTKEFVHSPTFVSTKEPQVSQLQEFTFDTPRQIEGQILGPASISANIKSKSKLNHSPNITLISSASWRVGNRIHKTEGFTSLKTTNLDSTRRP